MGLPMKPSYYPYTITWQMGYMPTLLEKMSTTEPLFYNQTALSTTRMQTVPQLLLKLRKMLSFP